MAKALTLDEKRERSMERAEARVEAKEGERTRTRRNAFNGTTQKLTVEREIPGYKLYIFNDTPGRIQQAQSSGWEFVHPEEVGGATTNVVSRNTDIGDKVRYLVGTTDGGEPLFAYLMKIKTEWWEEDQRELQVRNDKTDAAIRGGKLAGIDSTGFYDAGIKYGK